MKYTAHEFLKAETVIVPSTYAVAATTGAAIDTNGYSECLVVLHVGLASTSAELDVRLVEGDTSTPATHIAGSSFTQVTAANDKTVYVGRLDLTKRKRYITGIFKADGTNDVRAGLEFVMLGAKALPVSQEEAVAFNL